VESYDKTGESDRKLSRLVAEVLAPKCKRGSKSCWNSNCANLWNVWLRPCPINDEAEVDGYIIFPEAAQSS